MEALYQQYKEISAWFVIYIREAHPTDGWQVDANVEEGIEVEQPDTIEERIAIAEDFIADINMTIPVLIDGIDNAVAIAYKSWPDRIYILNKDGIVVFKGDQGPWGYTPEIIPEVLDSMAAVDAENRLVVTWGNLKKL